MRFRHNEWNEMKLSVITPYFSLLWLKLISDHYEDHSWSAANHSVTSRGQVTLRSLTFGDLTDIVSCVWWLWLISEMNTTNERSSLNWEDSLKSLSVYAFNQINDSHGLMTDAGENSFLNACIYHFIICNINICILTNKLHLNKHF